ncbi:TPA: hypothetical protein TUR75_001120 [Streptococcus equi subsp. zooepidemicus]|uniref:hypothetical protein n=1 Tax=Streptococcus equi TaxID=1336 RepID=UPI0013F678BB|nr:hypothetical protein [Streptococcus equi]MCD3395969.1 hypothetical protein [Streptococcus equi subsp. zooepidemicus]MCD3415771.1 hypothetical protein [Streptococcus equi subsp. zooepidemicus]MDI5918274.1 hypothetical protein [Streptococcus equi subsp. zooepidemicus]MDI5951802.1 hypothetical protein [Streptococcus equi subsp. zooepidemicus]MDI5956436.1 hypothetical protein [Streptococcus equi subsp. zooepidemicus]
MIDKTKQIVLVSVASLALLAFVSTMGYSLGKQSVTNETRAAIKQEAKKLQDEQTKKEKASQLSQESVEAFLRHYFTKKQLGENNKRIKPYLTDSAYREELTRQEDTLQQVYKDYILDYQYQEADIYLNHASNEVLAEVSYTVTYVPDLEQKDKAQTNQVEKRLLRLTYTKLGDKLLVNHLQTYSTDLSEALTQSQKTTREPEAIPELPVSTTTP